MEVQETCPLRTVTASSPLPVSAEPLVEEAPDWMPLGDLSCRKLKLALRVFRSERW